MEAIDFAWLAQSHFVRALFEKHQSGFEQQFPGGTIAEVQLFLPALAALENSRDALSAALRDFYLIRNFAMGVTGERVPLSQFVLELLRQISELFALRFRIAAYFTSGALDQLFYERAGLKIFKDSLHNAELAFCKKSELAYAAFVASGCVRGSPLQEINDQISAFKDFRLAAASFFERLEARPLGKALLSLPLCLEGDPLAGQIFAFFKSRNEYLKDRRQRQKEREQEEAMRASEDDEAAYSMEIRKAEERRQRTAQMIDEEAFARSRQNFFLSLGQSFYIYAELELPDIVFLRSMASSQQLSVPLQINEIMPRFCMPVFDLDVNKTPESPKFLLKDAIATAQQLRMYFSYAYQVDLFSCGFKVIHPEHLQESSELNAFPVVPGISGFYDPFICFIYASARRQDSALLSYHLTFPGLRWDKRISAEIIKRCASDKGLEFDILSAMPGFNVRRLLHEKDFWDAGVSASESHGLRMAYSAKARADEVGLDKHRTLFLRHVVQTADPKSPESSRFQPLIAGDRRDLVWNGHFLGAPFPGIAYTSSGDWVPRNKETLCSEMNGDLPLGERKRKAALFYLDVHRFLKKAGLSFGEEIPPPAPLHLPSPAPLPQLLEPSPIRRCMSTSSSASTLEARGDMRLEILEHAPTDEYLLAHELSQEEWGEVYHHTDTGEFEPLVLHAQIDASMALLKTSRQLRLLPLAEQAYKVEYYLSEVVTGYLNRYFAYVPSGKMCVYERIRKTWSNGYPIDVEIKTHSASAMEKRLGVIQILLWPSGGEAEESNSLAEHYGGRGARPMAPMKTKKQDAPMRLKFKLFELWNSNPNRLTFDEAVRCQTPEDRKPRQLDIGVRPYVTREMSMGYADSCSVSLKIEERTCPYYHELVDYFFMGTVSGLIESNIWLRTCLGFFEEGYEGTAVLNEEKKEAVAGSFVLRYSEEFDRSMPFQITRIFTVKHLLQHLHVFLCSADAELYAHVLKWYAYVLQNPGCMTGQCLVYQGEEGTGKNMINNAFCAILGPRAALSNGLAKQLDTWNSSISDKLLIVFNEVPRLTATQQAALRTLVTESHITVQKKFHDDRELRNCSNVILISNEDRSLLRNPGKDGRRYVYCLTQGVPLCDRALWFKGLFTFLGADRARQTGELQLSRGILALADYLYRVDLSDFRLDSVPRNTKGRERALLSNMTDIQDWFHQLLENGRPPPFTAVINKSMQETYDTVCAAFYGWGEPEAKLMQPTVLLSDLLSCFNAFKMQDKSYHGRMTLKDFTSYLIGEVNAGVIKRPAALGQTRKQYFEFRPFNICVQNFEATIGHPVGISHTDPAADASADPLSQLLPPPRVVDDSVSVTLREAIEQKKLHVSIAVAPSTFRRVVHRPSPVALGEGSQLQIVDRPLAVDMDRTPPARRRNADFTSFTQEEGPFESEGREATEMATEEEEADSGFALRLPPTSQMDEAMDEN